MSDTISDMLGYEQKLTSGYFIFVGWSESIQRYGICCRNPEGEVTMRSSFTEEAITTIIKLQHQLKSKGSWKLVARFEEPKP